MQELLNNPPQWLVDILEEEMDANKLLWFTTYEESIDIDLSHLPISIPVFQDDVDSYNVYYYTKEDAIEDSKRSYIEWDGNEPESVTFGEAIQIAKEEGLLGIKIYDGFGFLLKTVNLR
jgi:hypothetical protein